MNLMQIDCDGIIFHCFFFLIYPRSVIHFIKFDKLLFITASSIEKSIGIVVVLLDDISKVIHSLKEEFNF